VLGGLFRWGGRLRVGWMYGMSDDRSGLMNAARHDMDIFSRFPIRKCFRVRCFCVRRFFRSPPTRHAAFFHPG
jgi:hypothetical protein